MPKTVVGLFESAALVDDAVREIEALGLPRKGIHTLREPATFDVAGVMSFPRLDFETDLSRELTRIGATPPEARAYVEGVRRGGALAFATGSDENVEAAAQIMNRYGAVDVEQIDGPQPQMPAVTQTNMTPIRESSAFSGRGRRPGSGASFFVW